MVAVDALYNSFYAAGLQYGPGYRTLAQVRHGDSNAAARLQPRATHEGTTVHPADLDDALCVSAVASSDRGGDGETWLPFAVDKAELQSSMGDLWAVSCCLLPTASTYWCVLTPCDALYVSAGCGAAGRRGAVGVSQRNDWPSQGAADRF